MMSSEVTVPNTDSGVPKKAPEAVPSQPERCGNKHRVVVSKESKSIYDTEGLLIVASETQESLSERSARCVSLNEGETGGSIASYQPTLFTLKYLPRLMAESEVLAKIQKFGKISTFRFKPEICQKGTKDQKGNFKRAEFSFEEKTSEEVFKKVKRIRIKGLQVKILQGESEEQSSPSQRSHCELFTVDHSVRPTRKAYASKTREQIASEGLSFNQSHTILA